MRRWRGWAAAAVLLLAIPGMAAAAGISLDRSPSPPSAIQLGQAEQINWSITFTSVAKEVKATVTDPGGAVTTISDVPYNNVIPGLGSPINNSAQYQTGAGSRVGRYLIGLQFISDIGVESTATTVFDVAASLGNLRVVKYEDLNGNGARDAGEPGLSGWAFNLVNPNGGPSTIATDADGTHTAPNVPAGTWQVSEVLQPGWIATTPPSGTVSVPTGGTGSFTVGNARPGAICGFVWVDTNKNGQIDAGEVGRGGVPLTLTGTTGLGANIAPGTTTTGGDGSYCFTGVAPGTYGVAVTVPPGFTNTTPTAQRGIGLISNQTSPNHNFGIVQGAGPNAAGARGPAANLAISKGAPDSIKQGEVFPYRIHVANTSRFTARNVVLRDVIPSDMTLPKVPPEATNESGTIVWKLGDLKPKEVRVITFDVRLDPTAPAGNYVNTALVSATGVPPKRATATSHAPGLPKRVPRRGGVTG
jgi:uncharacterized repeat protein (TIGR01451 family)